MFLYFSVIIQTLTVSLSDNWQSPIIKFYLPFLPVPTSGWTGEPASLWSVKTSVSNNLIRCHCCHFFSLLPAGVCTTWSFLKVTPNKMRFTRKQRNRSGWTNHSLHNVCRETVYTWINSVNSFFYCKLLKLHENSDFFKVPATFVEFSSWMETSW